MGDIGDRLRIKYGLRNNPTKTLQERWADLTRSLIKQGHAPGAAGHGAAKTLFADFESVFYASEADTIEMLLQQVGEK